MNKKKLIIIIAAIAAAMAILATAIALICKGKNTNPADGDTSNAPTYIIYGDDNEVEDVWDADGWE